MIGMGIRFRAGTAPVFFLVCLFGLAAPAHAVLRLPSLEETDTLDLDPSEARDFQVHKLAGADLNDAGFYLALAALPVTFLAAENPRALGLPDNRLGSFLMAFGAYPVFAATMAAGNLTYGKATRYHAQRDYGISYSLLPFFACSAAAAKVVILAVNYDRMGNGGAYPALLLAMAASEVFFIPALRIQYRSAQTYLDQVRVRVAGKPNGLSLRVDF
jgi:hypothetical protein